MRLFVICFLAIAAFASAWASGQDVLPAWVPEGALDEARNQWISWMEDYDVDLLKDDFGLSSKDDALRCEMRDPFRAIRIDYESYEDGDDVSEFLLNGARDSAYGFCISCGSNTVGHIIVDYENSSWGGREICGYGNAVRGDLYGPMFDQYPAGSGFFIMKEEEEKVFFILKDRHLIAAYSVGSSADSGAEAIDAREYLLKGRAFIEHSKQRRQSTFK